MASGTVLVTGASTGIGEATVLHLRELGFEPLAGVRKRGGCGAARRSGIRSVMLDVTDAGQIDAVRAELGEGALAGLVNNAGIAVAAPLEFLPIEQLRRQLEINLVGQVAVTQALLPALRRGRGRIVNVSLDRRPGRAAAAGRLRDVEVRPRGLQRLAAPRAAPAGRGRDRDRAGRSENADLEEGQRARGRSRRRDDTGGRAALRPHTRRDACRDREDRAGARHARARGGRADRQRAHGAAPTGALRDRQGGEAAPRRRGCCRHA